MLAGLGAAALLAPLAACGDEDRLDGLAKGPEGRVTGIANGDAFDLEGHERVRLAGIEAPKGDLPYAMEAERALSRLAEGRRVKLYFGGAHADLFGRTIAQVRDADSRAWLQLSLLDQGAARVRTWADNRALARVLLAHEARARAANRGLWALPAYRVRLPQEVEPPDHGLFLVEGRVRRVGEGGGGIYLDFADDWRGTLSLQTPRRALKDFRAAGLDPLDLEGRLIRVRGTVNDLRMTVDHPEQIERLKG